MRFAGDSVRMRPQREQRFREARAGYQEQDFQYRDGLSITGEGPFPRISPGLPDTGLPSPMGGIYTNAPTYGKKVSVPTRIGNLG
jgi:hypothetical protein